MRIHICQYVDVDLAELLDAITSESDAEKAIETLQDRIKNGKLSEKGIDGHQRAVMSERERGRIDVQNWVRGLDKQGLAGSMTLRARDYLASMGVVV